MSLQLNVLGPYEAKLDGQIVHFPTERARLLLAYLAIHPNTPMTRHSLAALFWPDRSEDAARNSLRTELNRLKQAIGDAQADPAIVQATRLHIEFVPSPHIAVDLHQFQSLLAAVREHNHSRISACSDCLARLSRAVDLLRDSLLADIAPPESEPLERWLHITREGVNNEIQWVLDILVEERLESSRPEEAIQLARRQIELRPWHEPAHRSLIRALTLSGQRAAALRQYEVLTHILADELAAEPSPETVDLYRQISAGSVPTPNRQAINPYQGLQAFESSAAPFFFGRESIANRLYETVQQRSFVALIGPSGSGKSSVVQAGLLPQLDEEWSVVYSRPGAEPFQALTAALSPRLTVNQPTIEGARQVQDERAAPDPATLALQIVATHTAHPVSSNGHGDHKRLLLIVDQFEEVFTLCTDPQERQRFFDLLLDAAIQHAGTASVCVLMVLRADFMAQALTTGRLADLLQDATMILGPMNREELRRAIEQPALQQGVNFEPGLVERLLNDVGSEPGNLPLLQFALTLLWQEQDNGWLTHNAYDDLERVVGALTHYASGVYARLEPVEQMQAQRIFLQLIQPGQGTADTRRTATRVEIGEEDWRLVQHLADRRLVVTNRNNAGEETVELVHEALISEWNLLRNWLEIDREFRLWQQRVRVSMGEWQRSAQDNGALLRGGPLAEAEHWMQNRATELSEPLRIFIQAGIDYRQRRESAQLEQQRREFEQMQALALAESQRAETEARSSRRLSFLAAGMAVAFVLAVLAAAYAFQSQRIIAVERNRAEENARIALARQLSAQSMRNVESNLDIALLLGLASTGIGLPEQDRTELLTEIAVPPMLATILHNDEAPVFDQVFSADSTTLFVRDDKGSVWAWDLTEPSAPPSALIMEDNTIREVMFSAQGDRMAVNRMASVELWDLNIRRPVATLQDHADAVLSLGFSHDGRYLATSDAETLLVRDAATGDVVKPAAPFDGSPVVTFDGVHFFRTLEIEGGENTNLQHVARWNIETGELLYDPDHGHTSNVHSWQFSADGTKLATASFDGTVVIWDTATALQIGEPLRGHDGRVLMAQFSPDGKLLVSGGVDGQLLVWDLQDDNATLALRLNGHSNWIRGIAFNHDGAWMATGDINGHIMLWRVDDRQILYGHSGRARTVNISTDGRTMVSAGFNQRLGVWDAPTGALLHMLETEHQNAIINAKFSPDDKTVLSVDAGGMVIFWDTESWTARKVIPKAHENVIIGIAFSPDGRMVATGDFGGAIQIWDLAAAEPIGNPIQAHTWWALSLAFSPDSKMLASGGTDTNIKLWDVATRAQIGQTWEGHTNWVTDLLFSPDGAQLISASSDQTIRVWDVASGQQDGEPIIGHNAQVWTIQFYPPGSDDFLVSVDDTGKVLRWDWQRRQPIGPALATNVKTESMAVSTDGSYLYLGTFDPTIQRWALHWETWEEQACAAANRALSAEESERYLRGAVYRDVCLVK